MDAIQENLKKLPAVDKLLLLPQVKQFITDFGKATCMFAIRHTIEYYRQSLIRGEKAPLIEEIIEKLNTTLNLINRKSLKKVYNATGIIIHTNLGRTPLGKDLLNDAFEVIEGYNNLEFNLEKASRGSRNIHVANILKFLTGAEDILIVNNAAAAVMLVLRTFAKNKEVIISRGELIEIGGSFRIPEIMAASDCIMREVGATNKTKLNDYEQAVNTNTALLFKAHKSNYTIKGFTEEVALEELIKLGKMHNLPVFYDIGSGLLDNYEHPIFEKEPHVKSCIQKGVDIICFSGDKLLGGPQAGIIAGKKHFIDTLKNEPMFRALRVCKTTLALLETSCTYFLDRKTFKEKNFLYKCLFRENDVLKKTANSLSKILKKHGIASQVMPSKGRCGGGTLPEGELESYAVKLINNTPNSQRTAFAENLFNKLLLHEKPLLGILKSGDLYFDVLTIFEEDIEDVAAIITEVHKSINNKNNSG